MALKDYGHYTLYGAVEHVYQMERERHLPWARPEVKDLAFDALEWAERDWLAGRDKSSDLKTASAELEAAEKEGFDLRAIALKYLAEE
jgi:hypothetical protein